MQTTHAGESRPGAAYALFLGLILLLAAVIGAGYLGFRQFAAAVMPRMGAFDLLALAVIAGVASFFSPCAFPLLPGYFSFYAAGGRDDRPAGRPGRALRLGLAAAAGVITFNLILGFAIGLLGAGAGLALSISGPEPNPVVRWFRGGVGVVLIALGIGQWLGVNLKPGLANAFAWRTRPRRDVPGAASALYVYGLGYSAAGMGCTGPILAGLMVVALSAGGFGAALTAFAVYSAVMGGLMLLVSGLVATAQDTLIRRLMASAPRIKRVTSALVVLIGAFNILTAFNAGFFVKLLFP